MNYPVNPAYPFRVITLYGKLPVAFAPGLTAEYPPAHCLCTWTWTPARGGRERPFAMKYWNRACPQRHF